MVASTVVQPDPLPGAQSEVQADTADRDTAPAEPTPLSTPIDVRGAALVLIALVACAYALHWAGAVLIPVLLGLMASYALSPAVDRLQRWHIPRALGTAVLLVAVVCGLGSTADTLSDDAAALVEALPDAAQKVRDSLRVTRGTSESSIQKVPRAAEKLEAAAEESGPARHRQPVRA
jgi:predicted PurR-regulated permease PerM